MKRSVLVVVVLAAVVLGGAAALIARRTAPAEPRLVLPAVDRFAAGACRDAAEDVRALARLTHGGDVTALSVADRAELRRVQDRLVALRPAAGADVRVPLDAVVLALGHLRLRLDSRTAEPRFLRDVETARSALERTCVRTG